MYSGKVYIALIVLSLTILGLFLIECKDRINSVRRKAKRCLLGRSSQSNWGYANCPYKKPGYKLDIANTFWLATNPIGYCHPLERLRLKIAVVGRIKKRNRHYYGTGDAITESRTLLKPHIWVRNSWPGAIEMNSEGRMEGLVSSIRELYFALCGTSRVFR